MIKLSKNQLKVFLSQEFKNFELLIVDDGSRDASWKILNKFSKKTKE